MPSTKPRIRPYVDEDVYVWLRTASLRPGKTESDIVNHALRAEMKGEHEDVRVKAMLRRLDRQTRALEIVQRNQLINAEAFALFMRYFLTVIPAVSENEKAATQAEGHVRFTTYLESLRTVLEDGEPVLFTALEDVMVDQSAFFTAQELATLHESAPERVSKPKETANA